MNFQVPMSQDKPARPAGQSASQGGASRADDVRQDDVSSLRPARRYLIGAVALAAVLGGFWYMTHSESTVVKKRDLSAPVRVATATRRDMAVIEKTIGTVLPNSTVQVNARVQGQLLKAYFVEGQMVKTGDLLFQIDPRPYQAIYDNALASEASAKAKADRYARLIAQNAISPQDADDARASYLEAKANAEAARLNLEYTSIRSPVNGKTGPMLIQPGNMVTSGSSANISATPLVTINEIQPVKVSMALPQSDLPRIQTMAQSKGLVAHIDQHNQGGASLEAPINFISNAVNGTSGTIELRANFANIDGQLVPGQLVDVTIALANIPGAIVVPREAINNGPDGQYVYAVKDGRAEQRLVKVLFDDGKDLALEGPVKPGDTIVVEGQLRVTPGAKVSVSRRRKPASTPLGGVPN